jgi:hypothetical protein
MPGESPKRAGGVIRPPPTRAGLRDYLPRPDYAPDVPHEFWAMSTNQLMRNRIG